MSSAPIAPSRCGFVLALGVAVGGCSGGGAGSHEVAADPNDASQENLEVGPDDSGSIVVTDAPTPKGDPVGVEPTPTHPKDDTGKDLGWSTAPLLDPVTAIVNRDSAIVTVPAIEGAHDYRVITVPAGVSVAVDGSGKEQVDGSTIFCAGFKQRSGPPGASAEVMRQIQVAGLKGETRLVIEAIDTTCPFPGTFGDAHGDEPMTNAEVPVSDRVPFSIYTEAEIRARYGSMIVNGHGPGDRIGTPARPAPPKVLARTTVKITPLGYGAPPTKTFWDDFDGAQPTPFGDNSDPKGHHQVQTSKWTFTAMATDYAQMFFDRGQLHYVLADIGQDIFGSVVGVPKHAVQLSATEYLHVTFEVASTSTERRYWWFSLCGANEVGKTIGPDGAPLTKTLQTPFFYDPDGKNPTEQKWNCLQVFPRGGWPFPLAPSGANPESEVRVMLNKAGDFPTDNVINVSPPQYGVGDLTPASWYRTQDGSGKLGDIMLDDQHNVSPPTHFDFWIRRDRFVMFANGKQKICNDFPKTPLTMAEGALNFGLVLYHTTAERLALLEGHKPDSNWDRTGLRYVMQNEPYVDTRAWDNVGFDERVAAPSTLDETACYKSP